MIHGQDAEHFAFAVAFENFTLPRVVNKIFMRKNRAFGIACSAGGVDYDARIVVAEVGRQFGSVRADFIAESRNVMLSNVNRLVEGQRLVSQ